MQIAVVVIITILLVFTVGIGFGTEMYEIQECIVVAEKYVTAEYSRRRSTVCSSIDPDDGSITTQPCTVIDYWSKPASAVFSITTVNGMLNSQNGNFSPIKLPGYYTPPLPQSDVTLADNAHFDRFLNHSKELLTIYGSNRKKTKSFKEPATKAAKCNVMRGETVKVRQWYGRPYTTDFK